MGTSMEKSLIKRVMSRITDWYNGTFIPYKNDPSSPVQIIGGYVERHWTASAVKALVDFLSANWKFVVTSLIAIAGIILGFLKVP